ncbi:MAG: cbb3-type cytochrome c oxidase subunit I, partial [Acidobacteriota bacterium]
PILLMLVDTWRNIKHRSLPIGPRLTWFYLVGMAILHFVGAGLTGFAHTLPMINYYTHGSQVTVAHGHLSFFGAYVLVNLTFFYFAIPRLKGFPNGDYDELSGQLGFWLMSLGIVGMTLAFGVAGVLQTYLERIQGQPYMVAQQPIRFWMFVAAVHGLMLLAGTLITIKHLLTLKPARPVAA